MKSRLTAAVAGLAMAATLGACGGADEGPAAPSSDTFVERADRICTQGAERLGDEVVATFGNRAPTEQEGIAFTSEVTVPMLANQIEKLRSLTPPEGESATVSTIWDAMDDGLSTLETNPETAFGTSDPLAEGLDLASAYGFKSCGATSPGTNTDTGTGTTP
jgi:hypothetical protein